ncbi:MAG: hypothetical protein J7K00_02405 [Candidatus Diapherotrites archaeon]|nr:hypothetical protein [Candidatus Diapherotrites archaeon]
MKEVFFASGNKAKVNQFQFVADSTDLQDEVCVVSVYERFPQIKKYSEDFKTQREIAENGARFIFNQVQKPVVTEDSVIEIHAFGNKPGIRSNAYLKEKGLEGLLEDMKTKTDRKAEIVSVVAFFDGVDMLVFENRVSGSIAQKLSFCQGEPDWIGPLFNKFGGGYNAVFLPDAVNETGSNAGEKVTLADLTAGDGLKFGYRELNFRRLLKKLFG